MLAATAAFFGAAIPIVLWGYAFSYMDADRFNARRFLFGAFAGAVAVVPVAFMPEMLDFLSLSGSNVFRSVASRAGGFSGAFGLGVFLSMTAALVFLAGFLLRSAEIFRNVRPYLRSLFAVFLSVPVFAALLAIAPSPQAGGREIAIAGAALAGFASVALAYFVVAAVEEGGKHLASFSSTDPESLALKAPLYAAFAGLGFAFAENALYLFAIANGTGDGFFSTLASRSFFSVVIHVFCAVVVSVGLARSLRVGSAGWRAVKTVFAAFAFSLFLHAAFDVSVTYGWNAVVFLYLAFSYGYVTRAFAKEPIPPPPLRPRSPSAEPSSA